METADPDWPAIFRRLDDLRHGAFARPDVDLAAFWRDTTRWFNRWQLGVD
jgi:hypothetical protein